MNIVARTYQFFNVSFIIGPKKFLTNIHVKFTATIASKKKGLKKFVMYDIMIKRIVGI